MVHNNTQRDPPRSREHHIQDSDAELGSNSKDRYKAQADQSVCQTFDDEHISVRSGYQSSEEVFERHLLHNVLLSLCQREKRME
jgi:hypothetical protein